MSLVQRLVKYSALGALFSAVFLLGCPTDTDTPVDTDTDGSVDTDTDGSVDTDDDTDTNGSSGFNLFALSEGGGCGDITMYRRTTDGDWVLIFRDSDEHIAEAAYVDGTSANHTFDLSSAGSLEIWKGSNLTNLVCNDYTVGNESVDVVWVASAGSVTVTVETDSDTDSVNWGAYDGDGTIDIQDAVLESDGQPNIGLDDASWTAAVGWLPG